MNNVNHAEELMYEYSSWKAKMTRYSSPTLGSLQQSSLRDDDLLGLTYLPLSNSDQRLCWALLDTSPACSLAESDIQRVLGSCSFGRNTLSTNRYMSKATGSRNRPEGSFSSCCCIDITGYSWSSWVQLLFENS